MSTREVFDDGPGFTLYRDVFEPGYDEGEDAVFLVLEDMEFEASNTRITIRISRKTAAEMGLI